MKYLIGYYCAHGHIELHESEDYDPSCWQKGWPVYIDAELSDNGLPEGQWVEE